MLFHQGCLFLERLFLFFSHFYLAGISFVDTFSIYNVIHSIQSIIESRTETDEILNSLVSSRKSRRLEKNRGKRSEAFDFLHLSNYFIFFLLYLINITMHEAQVEKIVRKAVQRERKLWLSLFAFAFIFSLYYRPMHVVDANNAPQTTVDGLPVSRRMLQATAVAQAGKNIVAAEPASEISQLALATSPSPEQEQEDISSLLDALNSTPSPEAEFPQITLVPSLETLAPAEEAFLPPPKNFSSEPAIQCMCPPGPKVSSSLLLLLV